MKIKKIKAFTLAELMVLISILTVLFAAFAPVFTVRYKNASSDYVWRPVRDDTSYSSYSDVLNKALPAQSFIGITPRKSSEISGIYAPYSKVVIRSSDSLASGKKQAQIDFRYGDENKVGILSSSLFAGKNNILLGGPFSSITDTAQYNTAYGVGALHSITVGDRNTAIGYDSLNKLTEGEDNTAIGFGSGKDSKNDIKFNTFIGYNSGLNVQGDANTGIGFDSLGGGIADNNTAVGAFALRMAKSGSSDNTAVGYGALHKLENGSGNTYVGAHVYDWGSSDNKDLVEGSYNTAIGFNAGLLAKNTSYKTFIGYNSGTDNTNIPDKILTGNEERVFIGPKPESSSPNYFNGVSVLEVHNVNSKDLEFQGDNRYHLGDSSVFVNGNLIVRGQSFLLGKARNQQNAKNLPSLMSYNLRRAKHASEKMFFMGYDGNALTMVDGIHGRRHKQQNAHENCICAWGINGAEYNGIMSYDWSTPISRNSAATTGNYYYGGDGYTDQSTNVAISDVGSNNHNCKDTSDNWCINLSAAHGLQNNTYNIKGKGAKTGEIYSCCPILLDPGTVGTDTIKSDARLKDIGTPFTSGMNALKNLKVYNYTFKSDKTKLAHVGVIAQDLKRVFPNAVVKGDDGYYRIRWDEIFYSAINAVKELNSKIETLAQRVKNDKARIEALKKDNLQLKEQLDSLASELENLEN